MSKAEYKNIIFPGRHHILTNFQHRYLSKISRSGRVKDLEGNRVSLAKKPNIIWVITSANHSNTRRNPIPGNKREVAIERFSEDISATSHVFSINDLGTTSRFADNILKEISVQSRGQIDINPENTLVACSTKDVYRLYQKMGFRILPVELTDPDEETFSHPRPWDLMLNIVAAGNNWSKDRNYLKGVHIASRELFEKYNYGDLTIELFKDPLVGGEGDITTTRDYETYRRAFDEGAERKYELVKKYVIPGRIVDIGCATGSIIKQIGQDDALRESDIYGVEVVRTLFDICQQRKANGEFKNENTFFYQRNISRDQIFPNNSINTSLTFSLTHEIESYMGHEAMLRFLKQIYQQTAPNGTYINVDVVGPENREDIVLAKLNKKDGENRSNSKYRLAKANDNLNGYLSNLSTFARFEQFAEDFRPEEKKRISYNIRRINGDELVEIKFEDIAEFMSKKDYTDSWESEMHEKFCYWSYKDWKNALTNVGFVLNKGSKAYQNPWIIKNRFMDKVDLYELKNNNPKRIPYPPTNVLLVAEKK